jgi:hypothetical protein
MKIEDLDVLRPEPKFIRLGEKEIDVSFIPCGITFEVDKIVQELATMTQEVIGDNSTGTKRAFELSIKLCVLFCERKHPELNEEWFLDNIDALQIKKFTEAIQEALMRAYRGIDLSVKNPQRPKRKASQ